MCRDRNLPRRRENRKPRRVAGRSRTQRTQRGAEIAEKSGIGPTSSSLRSPRPSAFSALTILAVSRRRLRIPPGDGRAARALLRAICALGRSDLVSRPQRPTPSRKSETAAGCWPEPNTENAKRRRDRRESGLGLSSSSLRSLRPSAFSALQILAVSCRRLRIPVGDGRAARALLRAVYALGRSDLVSRPLRPSSPAAGPRDTATRRCRPPSAVPASRRNAGSRAGPAHPGGRRRQSEWR